MFLLSNAERYWQASGRLCSGQTRPGPRPAPVWQPGPRHVVAGLIHGKVQIPVIFTVVLGVHVRRRNSTMATSPHGTDYTQSTVNLLYL